MFEGAYVALVTPFKDGKVDGKKIEELVEFQIASGIDGILPCGTTGESATLSHEEHDEVIETVIQSVRGRVPVLAGTGSNSTREAIRLTRHAREAGADGALMIAPYYNKPTQEGIYHHYKAVADEVDIPIVLYNIQSRTGINMLPETTARLYRDCQNIVGIKEASGNLDQMSEIIRLCGDDFNLTSGDDALTLPVLAIGGKGVVSVVANIVPNEVKQMIELFNVGDITGARAVHFKLLPLIKAMFFETNPGPVKTAMSLLGMMDSEVRLPLYRMSAENTTRLKKALDAYGIKQVALSK
ncbi:MAG: 4-hydroxy-tetrahydrodipicolinate synthase [Candidatus Omnitrophica bacterium]|nr:4-hydroxy-tetrahydrodipicolinate synthase [Candidatus Omnitrophota bacterium]